MEAFPAHLKRKSAYTIVELAVVLGVMGVLLSIGLNGYRGFEYKAQLRGAQRSLINHLKMAQNEALSGVMTAMEPLHYVTIRRDAETYYVDGSLYDLGQNVSIFGLSEGSEIEIYFFHPAKEESSCLTMQCCHFACRPAMPPIELSSNYLDIILEHQRTGETACIRIEGRGLRVNRIYEITCP